MNFLQDDTDHIWNSGQLIFIYKVYKTDIIKLAVVVK